MFWKPQNRQYFGYSIRAFRSDEYLSRRRDTQALAAKYFLEYRYGHGPQAMLKHATEALAVLALGADKKPPIAKYGSLNIVSKIGGKGIYFDRSNVPLSADAINKRPFLQLHFDGSEGLQGVKQSLGKLANLLETEHFAENFPYIVAITYPKLSQITERFGFSPIGLRYITPEERLGIQIGERIFHLYNGDETDLSEPQATFMTTESFIGSHSTIELV